MKTPYDIEEAFAAIEDELIASMMRNMKRHHVEEISEKKQWTMWQAEQLKALAKYKKANQKKFGSRFSNINSDIDRIIRESNKAGYMEQEIEILNAIKNGFHGFRQPSDALRAEFFKLNERKLDALIQATTSDMQKAETAILRMADDQYRKAIFNAQVYANTGAGTYEKAVDMATKDMLSAGLNCVEYANGARHTLADYAEMAIRTASKRAYLQGEGTKRQEWGISTVIMNKRGNPCPKCLPFVGKVLIDDVWSGGSRKSGKYPLMSSAIAAGLYHPRCRDSHTTYFEGISTPLDDKFTQKELSDIEGRAKQEAKQQYASRQSEKFGRMAKYSLDEEHQEQYRGKKKNWLARLKAVMAGKNAGVIKEFQELLPGVRNEDAKNLFQQAFERTKFDNSHRKNSYFDPIDQTIYLSAGATADTIAHELFHEIDNIYGIVENGALTAQLEKDFKRLERIANKHRKSVEDMLYSKYPEAFEMGRRGIKFKEEYRAISDILNGMSGGAIRLGYRHEDSYWENDKSLERESWAQFGRMIFQKDEVAFKLAKTIFPETAEEVLRILKEMIK